MKTIKDQVREIIIAYILLEYKEYEWFESESGEKYNYFALAVKLHGKLEGVEWSITGNRPQVNISLSVSDENFLGETKYLKVDIDKWKLIKKETKCWNTHTLDKAKDFRAINPKKKK